MDGTKAMDTVDHKRKRTDAQQPNTPTPGANKPNSKSNPTTTKNNADANPHPDKKPAKNDDKTEEQTYTVQEDMPPYLDPEAIRADYHDWLRDEGLL